MSSWVLIFWIITGSGGGPSHVGTYASKDDCTKVAQAIITNWGLTGRLIPAHLSKYVCIEVQGK